MVSCWAASLRATFGFGCTSTMRPSAPAAMPASAMGPTYAALPAAWEGSMRIGRQLRSRTAGTAPMSSVLRVAVSYVRMPRSQSTTL